MSVLVCKHTRAQCDRAEFCVMRRPAPEDALHVMYFMPDTPGDRCPHFIMNPRDRNETS